MRDLAILFVHLITTICKLMGPSGARSVVAESLLVKQQLLIVTRSRQRAPKLNALDRIIFGLCALFMHPDRIYKSAIAIKPTTILGFHRALVKRKYRLLFSTKTPGKAGPKGPALELIKIIVEMKQRNPIWGSPKIAQQISLVFGLDINKDVVRRVLAQHYRPPPNGSSPSWLTFLGHAKDSLWSVDLFRCESTTLQTHWVLVVLDQFTRCIVGIATHTGTVDGHALCRMFNQAIKNQSAPKYLSSDHDPLFTYHRWRANLRILEIEEIKTVPYVPLSHPFVERVIGTIRRECLDKTLFWNERDLERKLLQFKDYYNGYRTHDSLQGETPAIRAETIENKVIDLANYQWKSHCRGLFQTPIAA